MARPSRLPRNANTSRNASSGRAKWRVVPNRPRPAPDSGRNNMPRAGPAPLAVVRACLKAYVDKDRGAIEALIAGDYYFTSPLDNTLDRDSYFAICWPNSKAMKSFDFIAGAEDGERAFVVYEGETTTGKRFRNCEVHTARGGKLV